MAPAVSNTNTKSHRRAAAVPQVYLRRIRKYLGAYLVDLGGKVDALVFSAGEAPCSGVHEGRLGQASCMGGTCLSNRISNGPVSAVVPQAIPCVLCRRGRERRHAARAGLLRAGVGGHSARRRRQRSSGAGARWRGAGATQPSQGKQSVRVRRAHALQCALACLSFLGSPVPILVLVGIKCHVCLLLCLPRPGVCAAHRRAAGDCAADAGRGGSVEEAASTLRHSLSADALGRLTAPVATAGGLQRWSSGRKRGAANELAGVMPSCSTLLSSG